VASRLVITRRGFGTMSALPASSGG
jgi:hypothetical protein